LLAEVTKGLFLKEKFMDGMEIKNAIITRAELNCGDRGFLSGWLQLDYGDGEGQMLGGGVVLYLPKSFTNHKIASLAGHWIFRVMEIAGVNRWDEISGKAIRVKATFEKVIAIGHIIKDDWFDPEKDFSLYMKKEEERSDLND
jgi:hypothetical protein